MHEAQKNSDLLSEYHDLYELQRQRLENRISVLTEEREIWSSAAYSLAMKARNLLMQSFLCFRFVDFFFISKDPPSVDVGSIG